MKIIETKDCLSLIFVAVLLLFSKKHFRTKGKKKIPDFKTGIISGQMKVNLKETDIFEVFCFLVVLLYICKYESSLINEMKLFSEIDQYSHYLLVIQHYD